MCPEWRTTFRGSVCMTTWSNVYIPYICIRGISYICFIYGDMLYNLFSYLGLSLTAGPCYAEGVSKEMRALKFAVCHAAGHRVVAMLLLFGCWIQGGGLLPVELLSHHQISDYFCHCNLSRHFWNLSRHFYLGTMASCHYLLKLGSNIGLQ